MKLSHYSLILWIAVFLVLGEVALEFRAHRRGFATPLFGGPLATSAGAAERVFGPTEDFPFRSRVVAPVEPAGTTRIWLASASYAQDVRVPVERIFPVLLEDELRRRGHAVEIVNASADGHSFATAARQLRDDAARWSPDLVLLYHYSNDVTELAPRFLSVAGGGAPNARAAGDEDGADTLGDDGAALTERERPWPSRLVESTTTYVQAKNQLKARLVALRLLADALPDELLDAVEVRVLDCVASARALGADVVLCRFAVSHPISIGGVLPAEYRNNLYRFNSYVSATGWRTGVDQVNARLVAIGEREGLPVLALPPRLSGRTGCFRDFFHLDEEGHREAALALADLLEPVLVARGGTGEGGGDE